MLHLVLFLVAVATVYYWLTKKPVNFPPGPSFVPLLGSLPHLNTTNMHFFLLKLKEKYGPLIGLKLGPLLAVSVNGMQEIEEVLKREEFQGRHLFADESIRDIRSGIMFSEGPAWSEQRRFTVRHLRDFGFGKKSMEGMILEEVGEFVASISNKPRIQVSGLFNAPTINMLWSIMGGKRFPYEDSELTDLLSLLQARFRGGSVVGGILVYPFLAKLFKTKAVVVDNDAFNAMRVFLDKSIEEHRATKEEGYNRDFLDLYLTEMEKQKTTGISFNLNTLKAVCIDLFGAGAESTGNTIGFCLLYLVLHPEWQDKLLKEVLDVIGSEQSSYDHRTRTPLVESFIAEVMRSNTIAPFTVPHKTMKDTTLSGYTIPKDTFIQVNLWSALQDKDYWGDPENFRPERFLDDAGQFRRDKWLYVFSMGKRVCPGESLARSVVYIFFTTLIKTFHFALPEGHPRPSTVCLPGFTTATVEFEIDIKKRSTA